MTGRASFLFGRPTFAGGIGSALDIGSTLLSFNDVPDTALADWLAMRQDWLAVGDDLRTAIVEELASLDAGTAESLLRAIRRTRGTAICS